MPGGIRDLRRIQIGKEIYGYGVPVMPTAQLIGSLGAVEDRGRIFPDEASGIMSAHRRAHDQYVIANLSFDAGTEGATFEQIVILLAMAVCGGVTPSVVDTLGRRWLFSPNLAAGDVPDIFTFRFGDNQYCWEAESVAARSMSLGADAQSYWTMTADLFGSQMDPSSFAGGILYPDPIETIWGPMTQLFVDDAGADIGDTPLDGTLIGWSIEIPAFHPKFFQDGQVTYSDIGLASRALTVTLNMEFNANAVAEWLDWRAATPRFMRIEALGSTIAGLVRKRVRIDMCLVYESHTELGDRDGNDIMSFTGRTVYNTTWEKDFEIEVINTIDALP